MSLAVVGLFVGLLVLLAIGVPVGFSLGLASVGGLVLLESTKQLELLPNLMWRYSTLWAFTMLPLFVFMAEVLVFTGIGSQAFTVAKKWVGWVPGGLGVGTVVACGLFAAVSASSAATAAAIGAVAIPEMGRAGYSRALAAGTAAAGGTLGILIPPSGILVIYGILTEESIGHLFMAGFIPGVLLVSLFSLYIMIYVKLRPEVAPRVVGVPWKERIAALPEVIPILVIMIIIFGGLYGGVATPTELAGFGAFTALMAALAFRRLNWSNLCGAFLHTVRISSMVFFILLGAMFFGYVLTLLKVPQGLVEVIVALNLSPLLVVVAILLLFVPMGMFMDPGGILVTTIPIFYPVLKALGVDLIWFGILTTILMEMANITPPVALNLFVIKSIAPEVSWEEIIRGVAPFVVLMAIGVTLIIAFPQIALWLPAQILK